jgi:hypothetical protein
VFTQVFTGSGLGPNAVLCLLSRRVLKEPSRDSIQPLISVVRAEFEDQDVITRCERTGLFMPSARDGTEQLMCVHLGAEDQTESGPVGHGVRELIILRYRTGKHTTSLTTRSDSAAGFPTLNGERIASFPKSSSVREVFDGSTYGRPRTSRDARKLLKLRMS